MDVNKDVKEKGFKTFLIFLNLIALPLVAGFVFSMGWEWFIYTNYGIKTPSISTSIGIVILINFFFNHKKREKDKNLDEQLSDIGFYYGKVIVGLLMLYIVHKCQ